MNRVTRSFFVACAVGVLSASVPATAGPTRAARMDKDVRQAKSNPDSLFNNPQARVITSDTGGHIAILFQKTEIADGKVRGERGLVQVEVTDPFGYYNGGAKKAPSAVLANIASEKVTSGHDRDARVARGTDITLKRTGPAPVYRGAGTVDATVSAGDDMDVRLGNIALSVAGKNSTWNSRNGKGYSVDHAPSWVGGTPAVAP